MMLSQEKGTAKKKMSGLLNIGKVAIFSWIKRIRKGEAIKLYQTKGMYLRRLILSFRGLCREEFWSYT